MKTKDIEQLNDFRIPLSWCKTVDECKRLNEVYRETVEDYAETDWTENEIEIAEWACERLRAELYFAQNLLEYLKKEGV